MGDEQKQQLQRIYDSHRDHRRTLANLPFEEKMKILIQMQKDFAAFIRIPFVYGKSLRIRKQAK